MTLIILLSNLFLLSAYTILLIAIITGNLELDFTIANWYMEGIIASIDIQFNRITSFFTLVVILITALVQIYSLSYLYTDPHTIRFMSYISLFSAFMILFVNSSNLLTLFIGWEGIGLLSGLLVSYWYNQDNSIRSALKAMFVNRIGDYALSLALFIALGYNLTSIFSILNDNTYIPIFILISLLAKSAQFTLHSWLPDAMAAPTPVSSLLHAATMVTAGLFLLFRFDLSSNIWLTIILLILSGLTAIFAGSIAQNLNDLKKIIAFSTCSQLGIIAVSLSLSGTSTALFHLFTHALFKALLFLGAGSVIHAINDYQDLRYYGNLSRLIPLTTATILTGSIALAGLPFLAGFYSKDSILDYAYLSLDFLSLLGFWSVTIATLYTGFYSFYSYLTISFNTPSTPTLNILHTKESDNIILAPLLLLSVGSIIAGSLYLTDNYSLLVASIDRSLYFFIYSLLPTLAGIIGYFIASHIPYIAHNSLFTVINKRYYWDKLNLYYASLILYFSYYISFKLIDKGILENIFPILIPTYLSSYSRYLFNIFYNSNTIPFAYFPVIISIIIALSLTILII